MADYRYEIKDKTGQLISGVVAAQSIAAAAQTLRAGGGYILALTEANRRKAGGRIAGFSTKIQPKPSAKDVLAFTNQLAVMIRAGISIRAALEGISDQVENQKFKVILTNIKRDVEAGKSFSEALTKYPKVFDSLYINMVRASELSGAFGDMLNRIADYMAQRIDTRNQVRGAMIYPAIIMVMAVAATTFLLTFVLPKFVVMFEGKEAILPAPTKAVLFISYIATNYWYIILGILISSIWGFLWFINTNAGKYWWDKTKLIIPVIKKLCRCLYITRGLHTMGELVNAGVPMLDTINITANISGNSIYKRMWHQVFVAVKEGKKISAPLAASRLLPRSVVQMIASGEESGKLADVLRDISDYYQKELKNVIKSVTAMIEPIMIVIMGAVVGFIAMSIILPIFKMSSLVK